MSRRRLQSILASLWLWCKLSYQVSSWTVANLVLFDGVWRYVMNFSEDRRKGFIVRRQPWGATQYNRIYTTYLSTWKPYLHIDMETLCDFFSFFLTNPYCSWQSLHHRHITSVNLVSATMGKADVLSKDVSFAASILVSFIFGSALLLLATLYVHRNYVADELLSLHASDHQPMLFKWVMKRQQHNRFASIGCYIIEWLAVAIWYKLSTTL